MMNSIKTQVLQVNHEIDVGCYRRRLLCWIVLSHDRGMNNISHNQRQAVLKKYTLLRMSVYLKNQIKSVNRLYIK